ncbi:hypothetical protein LCGC14_0337970 [marine sediment metagenome]|uniref:Uncharacterized protein n=1 Tax=marine sediment metagenome TaxID=412755 RepID=A0A0F9WLX9_9ZZZZ
MRRIFIKPDGSFFIHLAIPHAGESIKSALNRVWPERGGLPFEDVSVANFPTEGVREQWKWDGNKVVYDPSVKTQMQILRELEKQIDDELELESPNMVKIMRLVRKKEKGQL